MVTSISANWILTEVDLQLLCTRCGYESFRIFGNELPAYVLSGTVKNNYENMLREMKVKF